ncbi:helix-turn-helix domain-containing protein [Bacillus licheniformis]|nr:helix-turn-helix domain-containing protein [Bacillus licheniformis]
MSVYLETHCQISETAKRLYIHRNTVIYRLENARNCSGKPERCGHDLALETRAQNSNAAWVVRNPFPAAIGGCKAAPAYLMI